MSSIDSMPYEWGKFKTVFDTGVRSRRCVPDLYQPSDADGEVVTGGRECQGRYRRLEREMVEDNSAGQIRQDSPTIFINRKQQITTRIQSRTRDISTMRGRKGIRLVANDINFRSFISTLGKGIILFVTYLIKSKTVTRLPTGDNRQVPSGV